MVFIVTPLSETSQVFKTCEVCTGQSTKRRWIARRGERKRVSQEALFFFETCEVFLHQVLVNQRSDGFFVHHTAMEFLKLCLTTEPVQDLGAVEFGVTRCLQGMIR